MQELTRQKLEKLFSSIAKNYGTSNPSSLYSASPSMAQKLVEKRQESLDILRLINVKTVTEREGEKIFGTVAPIIPGRTNTSSSSRETRPVLSLDNSGYRCEKSEFDIHITYEQLDNWAKFEGFNEMLLGRVRHAIALGQLKVAFYGESVGSTTDLTASPNGEDVNKGWIQVGRDAGQVISDGAVPGEIRLGAGGDYANLDAMVFDHKQLIDPVHRDRTDLVALIGADLLAADKGQLYKAQGETPTEKEKIETASITSTYGGVPSMTAPGFPGRGLVITPLDNLSIYVQESSIRQKIKDNSERDRVEHYNSENDDYVVEDTDAFAVTEFKNVKLKAMGEF